MKHVCSIWNCVRNVFNCYSPEVPNVPEVMSCLNLKAGQTVVCEITRGGLLFQELTTFDQFNMCYIL